jgi:DNA repair protein RecN (Recombination protein N)
MITRLTIENYALIRKLEIDFNSGFNVITGETGAGKSILVGAISLLFGQRADGGVLFDASQKCIIEGFFTIADLSIQPLFDEYDLDYDLALIIRREITPQGKSRAFINDTPVTLNALKAFAERLIDIHSQHHSLLLNESLFQLSLVDQFAGNSAIMEQYSNHYQHYVSLNKTLANLKTEEQKAVADRDYFSFLFEEIAEVNPQSGEEVSLEEELNLLTHAEAIKSALYKVNDLLLESDFSILNQLAEVKNSLAAIHHYYPQSGELLSRIESCYIELKDIAEESLSSAEEVSTDASKLEQVSQRLDILNKLFLKHRISTADELIVIKKEFDLKLNAIASLDSEISRVAEELKQTEQQMEISASKLTTARQQQCMPMSYEIKTVLSQLGMKDAEITIEIAAKSVYSPNGRDDVRFLFSANRGQSPKSIDKVASGGEISRLMLAIKSLIHTRKLIPIAIFDEIDTGVSGDVAAKVGNILAKMSHNMQIIAITHLPQIAAKADNHFWVYKETLGNNTLSNIKLLSHPERVDEIAQMISGEQISEAAIATAQNLLNEK